MSLIDIPHKYCSAYTKRLMKEPVLTPDGKIVDKTEYLLPNAKAIPELKKEIEQFNKDLVDFYEVELFTDEEFIQAVQENNVALLQQKFFIDEQLSKIFLETSAYGTPLQIALDCEAFDAAKYLIEQGAPLKDDDYHYHPIHRAARIGNLELTRLILEKDKSTLNLKNDLGLTPLYFAAMYGHKDVVKYLLQAGARSTPTKIGYTPFLAAIDNHFFAIAQLILLADSKTLGDYQSGLNNPVAVCIKNKAPLGFLMGILQLSREGLETKDRDGLTPLHLAIQNNYQAAFELLILNGANVNTVDNKGNSLFHTAAATPNSDEILKQLIKKHCLAIGMNDKGQTPLDVMDATNVRECKKLLLEYFVSLDKTYSLEKQANEVLQKDFVQFTENNTLLQMKQQQEALFKVIQELKAELNTKSDLILKQQSDLQQQLSSSNSKIMNLEKRLDHLESRKKIEAPKTLDNHVKLFKPV